MKIRSPVAIFLFSLTLLDKNQYRSYLELFFWISFQVPESKNKKSTFFISRQMKRLNILSKFSYILDFYPLKQNVRNKKKIEGTSIG